MAAIILTGVPGTGKTLYGIQKYIIPALKKGQVVFTNIDGLILRRISYLFNIDIFELEKNLRIIKNPEFFFNEAKEVPNCLVVIDETQNIFSNREWQKSGNQECINYLMEHRHYGHSIVFITPHVDSVDAGIRRVVEFTYKHKSFSALGSHKSVRCAVFDQCNVNKPPVQIFSWTHDTRIYDCYSSYFKDGTKEEKVRVHPFRNATLITLVIFVCVAMFFTIRNGLKLKERYVKPKSKTVNVEDRRSAFSDSRKIIVISGDTLK